LYSRFKRFEFQRFKSFLWSGARAERQREPGW
jgi:hypothetical protein